MKLTVRAFAVPAALVLAALFAVPAPAASGHHQVRRHVIKKHHRRMATHPMTKMTHAAIIHHPVHAPMMKSLTPPRPPLSVAPATP